MAVVEDLLRSEADGAVSFGNHKLAQKAKVEDFKHAGDLLKVKTYKDITKLEKNGMFLYESVPGTSVNGFKEQAQGVELSVEGDEDAQITIGLADDREY
ncbi:MAG: endosialidase, partial [Lachnospiraceae bacterium]|nr:endosialidase [Lachnospiraceae bacterium]